MCNSAPPYNVERQDSAAGVVELVAIADIQQGAP